MRALPGLLLLLVGCTPAFDRPRPGIADAGAELARREASVDAPAPDLVRPPDLARPPDLVPDPDRVLCGPTLCAGCCAPDGVCHPGVTQARCGSGGAACVACSSGCDNGGFCKTCQPSCAGKPCGLSSDGCGGTCLAGSGCKTCGSDGECPWTYVCLLGSCVFCQGDFKLVSGACLPSCKKLLEHHDKLASPWNNKCCSTKCKQGVEFERGPGAVWDCNYCCSTKTQTIQNPCS